MNNSIEVVVKGREGTIFEGKVASLSSLNDSGKFDILPTHANFISLVAQRLILKFADGTAKDIPVDNGVVRVQKNKISVYLGIKK